MREKAQAYSPRTCATFGSRMLDVGSTVRIGVAVYRLAQRRIRVIGSTAWPMADGRIFNSVVSRDEIPRMGRWVDLFLHRIRRILFRQVVPRFSQEKERWGFSGALSPWYANSGALQGRASRNFHVAAFWHESSAGGSV